MSVIIQGEQQALFWVSGAQFVWDSAKWIGVEGQARAWVTVRRITPKRGSDDKAEGGC